MTWCFDRLVKERTIPILWGAWSAIDQYRLDRNASRPGVVRPTDRELLEAAANDTLNGELFGRFCREYEVFRNPINVLVGREKRLEYIANVLAKQYGHAKLSTSHDLATAWWGAVESVRDSLQSEFGKPYYMRSVCMKSLWLYQPEYATMWDSYALKGLKSWRGAKLSTNVKTKDEAAYFLQEFDAFYREKEREIANVLETIARLPNGMFYPYGRRVLDKALWFQGAKESEQRELLATLTKDPERDCWLRNQLTSFLDVLVS